MRVIIAALLIAFIGTQHVAAHDVYVGHLETQDIEQELSWRWFKCDQTDQVMECDIFITSIKRESNKESIVKAIESLTRKSFQDFRSIMPNFCGTIEEINSAISNMEKTKKNAWGEALGEKEWQVALEGGKLVSKACESKSDDDIKALMVFQENQKLKTCRARNDVRHEKFSWDAQSESWVSRKGPIGPCGLVSIGSLRSAPEAKNFWKYTEGLFVSNPSARTDNGSICESLNHRPHVYHWQAKQSFMECESIINEMH